MPDAAALVTRTLPGGNQGTWTSATERTGQGAARLPMDNVRSRPKPAAKAGPGVADRPVMIGKGDATGEYTVTGTIELSDYAWLVAEKIEAET